MHPLLHDFLPFLRDVQKERQPAAMKLVKETDAKAAGLTGVALADYLTGQSDKFANETLEKYRKLSLELITKMTDYCPLNFKTDENL